ncbi:MAG: hypothetical protein ACQETO_00010 [Pseudomonadota bacterium]
MNLWWLLRDVRFHAALSSLLLSAVAVMLGQGPNEDGFIYLRTAEIFVEDGLVAAFRHYPWATHSVLIGLVQQLPGVDFPAAAQWLNALWYAVVTVAFVNLVREFSPSSRVTVLAAVTVLAWPLLNEFRFYIIRDIAFLGLALWAAWFLLRYYRHGGVLRAAACCALLAAAALFRAEALALLLLTPLSLLAHPEQPLRQRFRRLLPVWGMTALLLMSVLAIFLLADVDLWERLRTVVGTYRPFLDSVLNGSGSGQAALTEAMFTDHAARHSAEYTGLILTIGLTAMLIARLLESLGIVAVGIIGYGMWRHPPTLPRVCFRPWVTWLVTSLAILVLFTLVTRFMTTRYTLLFSMLLLVLVPLIMDRIWTAAEQTGRQRRFAWVFGLLLAYSAIDAHITFGEPKTWLPATIEWLEQETDADTPLRTNERYIAWRSGRIEAYDQVRRDLPAQALLDSTAGTVLVVERQPTLSAAMREAEQQGRIRELARFEDRRGPRIIIYRRL